MIRTGPQLAREKSVPPQSLTRVKMMSVLPSMAGKRLLGRLFINLEERRAGR